MKRLFNILIISVFTFSFLVVSTFYKIDEVESAANKVITQVAKKATIKTMTFIVDKKAKETMKHIATKEVSAQVAKNYVPKTKNFLMVRNSTDLAVYNAKKVNAITKYEEKALNTAIQKNIERKIIKEPDSFKLFFDIVDFFTDYRFIVGGASLLFGALTGTQKNILNEITFDSLVDVGLLTPAKRVDTVPNEYVSPNKDKSFILDNDYTTELPYDHYAPPEEKFDGPFIDETKMYESKVVNKNFRESFFDRTFIIDFDNKDGFFNPYDSHFIDFVLANNEEPLLNFNFNSMNYYGSKEFGFYFDAYDENWEEIYSDGSVKLYVDGVLTGLQPEWDDFVFDEFQGTSYEDVITKIIRNLKRLTITTPPSELGYQELVIDGTDFKNNFKIVFVFNLEKPINYTLTESNFNLKSTSKFDLNFNIKVIDNTKFKSTSNPKADITDIPVQDSDFDQKDQIKIPNITEIPIKDKNGDDLEIVVTPDKEIEIVNPSNPEQPITNPDDVVVGEPSPDLSPDLPTQDVDTTPDGTETPDPNPDPNPNPGDDFNPPDVEEGCDAKLDISKFKSITNDFTHAFPFSIPWDIMRAIDAIFGGLESENRFSVKLPVYNTEIEISMPDFFDRWQKFIKGFLLVSWDIGIIYALRKWWGASE